MNFYKKYDYFQKIIFNQAGLNQAVKKTAQVFFCANPGKEITHIALAPACHITFYFSAWFSL